MCASRRLLYTTNTKTKTAKRRKSAGKSGRAEKRTSGGGGFSLHSTGRGKRCFRKIFPELVPFCLQCRAQPPHI
ncbi:unnamed protein product [Tenebrio molitor]|nr:unnamed protein product [Tenebrio molitor]